MGRNIILGNYGVCQCVSWCILLYVCVDSGMFYHFSEEWNTMNQSTGNLERKAISILDMQQGNCMWFPRILPHIYQSTSMLIWFFFFSFSIELVTQGWLLKSWRSHHESWIKLFGLLFVSYRRILHKYANEDVSLGAWFIGLDVEQLDDRSFCCGTPPGVTIFMNK